MSNSRNKEGKLSNSFYYNNKVIIWLLIIVIIIIVAMKFISFGNSGNSSSKEVYVSIMPTGEMSVGKGNTINLVANTNIEEATIIWTSSDSSIATVSNGSVKGIDYGKATITATCIDNNQKKYSASKEITVVEGDPNIGLQNIKFPEGDLYLAYSKEYKLTLIVNPSNALISSKTFTSSDESVVIVNNDGVVHGVGDGYARIIVTVNGQYKTALDVYVSHNFSKSEMVVSPTTISFDNSSRKIKVGDKEKLGYHVSPGNADKSKFTWTSSSKDVVSVDEDGRIKALKEGTSVITVTSINGRTDSIDIEVYNDIIPVENIILSSDKISMESGKTEVITPIIMPSNASNKGLSYSSSDTNVVTVTPSVDGTMVTLSAIKKGNAYVIVKSGNIEKKLSVIVTGDGNNSEIDDDDPKLPTTIKVRSDKNNLAKSYEEAKKIPVYGETSVTITMSIGVGKIKYCINKYGSTSCTPNIELYGTDTIKIPSGDIYVLRVKKYDYTDKEIKSESSNYIDGVLNYYINTKNGTSSNLYTITGAYDSDTKASSLPNKLNSQVEINVTSGGNGYLKACATSGNSACTPSTKITGKYTFVLNKIGLWHIIVNEYDKNNNQVGNSKVYYAKVYDDNSTGQYKASNLNVYHNNSTNKKYLSVDVESDIVFSNTRFCYKVVSKNSAGTCNLDLITTNVNYNDGGTNFHPKEELKTYYGNFTSTTKKTFNFYIDELDNLYNTNDTNKDVIFEFALKSSKGYSTPFRVRINMVSKSGNTSSWSCKNA